jgi:hypothetical protein
MSLFTKVAEGLSDISKSVKEHTPDFTNVVDKVVEAAKSSAEVVADTAKLGVQKAAEGVRDGADSVAKIIRKD